MSSTTDTSSCIIKHSNISNRFQVLDKRDTYASEINPTHTLTIKGVFLAEKQVPLDGCEAWTTLSALHWDFLPHTLSVAAVLTSGSSRWSGRGVFWFVHSCRITQPPYFLGKKVRRILNIWLFCPFLFTPINLMYWFIHSECRRTILKPIYYVLMNCAGSHRHSNKQDVVSAQSRGRWINQSHGQTFLPRLRQTAEVKGRSRAPTSYILMWPLQKQGGQPSPAVRQPLVILRDSGGKYVT